jgi:hypothetical protein
MKAVLTCLVAMFVALVVPVDPSQAQNWTNHRLADVVFEAPAGWKTTSSRGDRALILADASGRELRVEWWMQDEPFLGYSDIVAHKRISIAGKRATWKHSSFPGRQSVGAVVDEKRKDGRQLLLVLEVPGRDGTAAIRLFDDILARVRFGKAGEPAATVAPGRATPPRPEPAMALSPQMQAVAPHVGPDCEAVALEGWTHPALSAIRARKQARLEWAMLCRNRSHAVFGMRFDLDPQGRTGAFFMPLYDEVLTAGGDAAFSFVSLRDKLIIDVSRPGKDEVNVDVREVPALPDGASQGGGPVPGSGVAGVAAKPYLPAPEQRDVRLFLGRASFSAPLGWEARGDADQTAIGFVRPDGKAEIMVLLWPDARPLPSEGVERLEHVIVADAPAVRYRQKIANGAIEHLFFEDSFPDGSRISVSYRVSGEAIEEGAALLELFLADLDLNDAPPGGWVPVGPVRARRGDPLADLDMSSFEKPGQGR